MTTLLTGFEPFAGFSTNTSELLVNAVAALDETADVVTAILPTSYRRAGVRIEELLDHTRPNAILMLGLHAGTEQIHLEQVALNLDDSSAPDNDGEVRLRQRIIGPAPVGYWTSLVLDEFSLDAAIVDEEVGFSHDAGGFVCNHVFFVASHYVATQLPDVPCGFVHLPAVEHPGERFSRLVTVVSCWIKRLSTPQVA